MKSILNDIISKINLLTKTSSDLENLLIYYSSDKVASFDFTLNIMSTTIYEYVSRISRTKIKNTNLELEI